MNFLTEVCIDCIEHDFPQLIAEGFSPKKSHFNRLGRRESNICPLLYVKCLIYDSTMDIVDVKPIRSHKIDRFPTKFIFLQVGRCNVGDEVLIRSETFPNEYYLSTLLDVDETSRFCHIFTPASDRRRLNEEVQGETFWIHAKYVISFQKFSIFKKMSLEYILN